MADAVVIPCPLGQFCPDCQDKSAEVRFGKRPYVVMDECSSQLRTMSGRGVRTIKAMMPAAAANTASESEAGKPAGEAADEPPPTPKAEEKPKPKRGGGLEWLGMPV